ncbi:hypothetical protein HYZ64_01385, partial [Candidatus Berkelbacteria bacterium]|nr:hypothetical protein [Candidatus Berkelbacteria bacterium]
MAKNGSTGSPRRGKGSEAERIELPKVTIDLENGRSHNDKRFDLVAAAATKETSGKGLEFTRLTTKAGIHPFDEITWENRDARIIDEKGNVMFEQLGVEVPEFWSQFATDIATSKYFRKKGLPTPEGREVSAKQLITRVAHTIRKAGENLGSYFKSGEDAEVFEAELTSLLINQKVAFNSPVWFNCGLYQEYGIEGSGGNWFWNPATRQVEETANAYQYPQCSACF